MIRTFTWFVMEYRVCGHSALVNRNLRSRLGSSRLGFLEAMWRYTTGFRLQLGLEPGKMGVGSSVFLTSVF